MYSMPDVNLIATVKLNWRAHSEQNSIWASIIRSKYLRTSWVWKISAHPRVIYFVLWLALQDRLATKVFPAIKNISINDVC